MTGLALFSLIYFIMECVRPGSRSKTGTFFCWMFCMIPCILFHMSVFCQPENLFRRRILKWSMFAVMLANFIYGMMYVSNHIEVDDDVIVLCIFN